MVFKKKSKQKIMGVWEHLNELRIRLCICTVFVFLCTVVSYYFVDQIRSFATTPVMEKLIFVSLPEAFLTNIKISLITGIIISMPLLLQQFWSFVLPGLTKKEKIGLFFLTLGSIIFFSIGIVFAYYVILPFSISFFLEFASADLHAMITFSSYISFIGRIIFAFGAVFQLPLAVFILAKMGFISHEFLANNRKIAVVPIFIIAAFITPPDVISQILLAVPLLGLYELSILMTKLAGN